MLGNYNDEMEWFEGAQSNGASACGGDFDSREGWISALSYYPKVNHTVFNDLDLTCIALIPFLDE
jgi:hypothetical protein